MHNLIFQHNEQSSRLTYSSRSQLATNRTKNTSLYVTLRARKVPIEERKQVETTRVTPPYKATIVLR